MVVYQNIDLEAQINKKYICFKNDMQNYIS